MATKKLLERMCSGLNREKRGLNQFYITSQHTITDLYRTDAYVEQIKAIIKKLRELLATYENEPPSNKKEYAKLVNDIAVEIQYLKASSEAMEDNLEEIRATESLHRTITGEMIDLKKDVSKLIDKAEKVINIYSR